MNQIIKTTIDGVPVEIEITKMGPATAPEIKSLENNISKEDPSYVPDSNVQKVNSVKIGTEDKPASEEDVKKVQMALQNGNQDLAVLVQNLVNSVETVPTGKNWWESKTVWLNGLAIIAAVLAYFNVDFKINQELFATLFPLILAVINLYLRKGTDIPLTNKVIPPIPLLKK